MFKQLLAVRDYPSLLGKEEFSFSTKLGAVLKIYGILLLLLIFGYFPIHSLADYLVQNVLHYKNLNLQYKTDMNNFMKKLGYIPAFIYICLIGPIIEEVIFRLPLSFKKKHIIFSLGFAMLLFSGMIPVIKVLDITLGVWPTFAIRAAAGAILYFIGWKLISNNVKLKEGLKVPIIILSMCIFGLMHIGNYVPIQWPIFWIYPVYVLPQLLIGWCQTFVRFKYGFVWGIVLHCLVNTLSTGLYFAYKDQAPVHKTKSIPVKAKTNAVDTTRRK